MIADSNKILSVMGKDENAYSEAEKIALLREVTKAMAAGKSPFDARDIEHITSGHNSATQFYYFYENEFGNPEVSATQAAIPSQGTGINNSAGSGNDSEGILKMVQEMGPWGAVIIGILAMVAPNIIASIPGVKNLPFVETLAKDGGFMDKAGGWTIALGLLTMVVSGDTMAEKFENIKTQGMAAVNIPGLSNDNSRTV